VLSCAAAPWQRLMRRTRCPRRPHRHTHTLDCEHATRSSFICSFILPCSNLAAADAALDQLGSPLALRGSCLVSGCQLKTCMLLSLTVLVVVIRALSCAAATWQQRMLRTRCLRRPHRHTRTLECEHTTRSSRNCSFILPCSNLAAADAALDQLDLPLALARQRPADSPGCCVVCAVPTFTTHRRTAP
jgi:hypothetical protein